MHLEVDWQPERYVLSQGLASLLGLELETRHRVIEVPPILRHMFSAIGVQGLAWPRCWASCWRRHRGACYTASLVPCIYGLGFRA